jgi:2-polyprenyl-3-methyl-5-hydroxy-6-metoxy-1,4-benzoquinol methylase
MNLLDLADNIEQKENGIFFTKSKTEISYPEEGNQNCFQYEDNSFWFKHRNNIICNSIKKYSPSKSFFDIGGGNGFVAKRLQEENVEVTLVEPGILGALNAKKRGVDNIVCCTLNDAGFKKESLESVGFFDVMEHIEDDHEFLKDVARYLKPKGFLYLSVPALSVLWSKDDEYAGHFRRYTLKELKTMLKKQGYEVKYASYFFSFLTLPIFLFKTIPSKFGLSKDPSLLENQQDDHQKNSGFIFSSMNYNFKWETERLGREKKIFTGSTCFVIAQKMIK